MGVIQFSVENSGDSAALSGGSWSGTLPLTNLQGRPLSKVARSSDALATSTRIDAAFASDGNVVRLVGLLRHNISTAGTYRVTAGTTPGGSDVYDSGTLDVWPAVFLPEDLEWEDDNFWTGQISAADALNYPINLLHDCGANYRARYWRVQVTDTGNASGYVQAGRLWLGPVIFPVRSYQFGASLVWEPRSQSEMSLGGVLYFDPRESVRVFSFTLGSLSYAEAFGATFDAQRTVRTDKELIVIPDPDDAQRAHKRNIYGRFRRIDPLVQATWKLQSAGFEIEEML